VYEALRYKCLSVAYEALSYMCLILVYEALSYMCLYVAGDINAAEMEAQIEQVFYLNRA
jgi:hypothetical protein